MIMLLIIINRKPIYLLSVSKGGLEVEELANRRKQIS